MSVAKVKVAQVASCVLYISYTDYVGLAIPVDSAVARRT